MAETTHHFSDVDTWKNPDRNFFVFMVISVLFGFLGGDHFYLRSFGTGTQKLFMNLLTFGFWYWWDLIQIIKDGSKVRTDGLSSPFDWVHGIGRGVFTPLKRTEGEPIYVPKKSYLLYAFLAIFFGWLGADKFYIGEFFQGCAKLFSCFNIFILLFGWLWVIWDSVHAFFLMDSVLKDGISPPLPYSWLFTESTPGDMFLVNHIYDKSEDNVGILDWIAKTFQFPSVPVFPWKTLYTDLVVPFMTPPLMNALRSAKGGETCPPPSAPLIPPPGEVLMTLSDMARNSPPGVMLRSVVEPETLDGRSSMEQRMSGLQASSAPQLPTVASLLPSAPQLPTVSSLLPSAPQLPTAASLLPSMPQLPTASSLLPSAPQLPTASSFLKAPIVAQRGGGETDVGAGPGPVIAGTLTALVLAGGLKGFYDVISKQYG